MLIKKCLMRALCVVMLAATAPIASAQFSAGRQAADADKVIAVVNGKQITLGEWLLVLETGPPELVRQFQIEPKAAISDWYITEYLGQQAEEQELDQLSPYKEQLKARRMELLTQAMVNYERNSFPVPDEVVEQYYEAHRADYVASEVDAIWLPFKAVVSTSGTSADALQEAARRALTGAQTARSETEALGVARDLVKQLRDGADFAELAMQYSEDQQSKAQGGKFGSVSATSSHPTEFKAAVGRLSPGEISDPIRLSTGFYVVRVTGQTARPLRDVRGDIFQTLQQQHLVDYLEQLRQQFATEVVDQEVFLNPDKLLQ